MRISHLFILLAASAMLTACDFLDEYNPNSVTVGNYYTSEEDIVASLNGVYTSLTQSYVADNYHYFTDVRANATVVTSSGANSGIPYQFYNYTLTEENVYVYNRYSQLYKIISRANTLFAHLGDVSYATPSARDTYEAEARFLRALSLLLAGNRVGRRAIGAQGSGEYGRGSGQQLPPPEGRNLPGHFRRPEICDRKPPA